MKYIKKFNENFIGDFIRKKFNEDEATAIGIYRRMDDYDITIDKNEEYS